MHGSRRSLTRRQLSQTQSEPDNSLPGVASYLPARAQTVTAERNVTFAEPKIKVIPPNTAAGATQSNPRSLLMAMHTEYTSITDELETVCGLLSPPRTPRLLSPPRPGQAQPTQSKYSKYSLSNPTNICFQFCFLLNQTATNK